MCVFFFLIGFTVSYFGKGNGIVSHYLKNEFQLRGVRRARFIRGDRCHDDPVGERSTGIFQSYGTLRNILVISRQTIAFFHFRPNFETFIAIQQISLFHLFIFIRVKILFGVEFFYVCERL